MNLSIKEFQYIEADYIWYFPTSGITSVVVDVVADVVAQPMWRPMK